jgi:arylsulfatase A-like enzyme
MGNRIIRTPNVDRLARDGVVFDNNFVSTAICMTSRASYFTSLMGRSHGVSSFARPLTPDQMTEGKARLAGRLPANIQVMKIGWPMGWRCGSRRL